MTRPHLGGHALPEGVRLHGAGQHRLSAVERPEPVYQLLPALLPAAPLPLRPLPWPPTNLPVQLTSLVGRERERAAVAALLGRAALVTLVGAGGCGKTRLALAVAADLLEGYPDGAWLVELAALREGALAPGAVALALGVREEPGRPLADTLAGHLRDKRALLVLDNCEHLLAACAELAAALLRRCPHVQVLATSRERLGIGGEVTYRVPSLSLPAPDQRPTPAALGTSEAARLFVERARAGQPDFALSEGTAGLVGQICRRLDGLPLAIELAAARVGNLPLGLIAARLEQSLGALTEGPRDVPPRHRTLRAALDWGWALLGEPERALLRRLSVFAGGWRAEAAEAICAGGGVGAEGWPVLGLLGGLVGKSLVGLDERAGEARYGLLEAVRQYAAERLIEAGEEVAVRGRHLAHYLGLAEMAEPELTGPEQDAWLGRLEAEHDNLRAALGWARERGAGEEGLRLAASLWRFWRVRGYPSEGRGWLETMLARGDHAPVTLRARALDGAGGLAYQQGDYGQAHALYEDALTLHRASGNKQGIAAALNGLGNVAFQQDDYGRATALHEEALALRRELGDTQGIAASLGNLGNVAHLQGDQGRAAALFGEALALQRALGDTWGVATSLNNLGLVASLQGDYGRAAALHEEALALDRRLGNTYGIARSLSCRADVAYQEGDYGRAAALQEESLALRRELGDTQGIAASLSGLGSVARQQGDYDRAAALHGEALALRRELGDTWGSAISLNNLGLVARLRGDYGRAAALLRESLLLSRDVGARELAADGLESLAWLAARRQPRHAARLAGAAETLRESLGVPLSRDKRPDHDQAVRTMRAALGGGDFATAWAEGRTLPLEQALVLAAVNA